MKKDKEKKINLYQIIDKDGDPIKIQVDFYSADIKKVRTNKIYKSLNVAIAAIKSAKDYISSQSRTTHITKQTLMINGVIYQKDEFIAALLSLRIRSFVPGEITDLTFYFDKLK